MVLTDANIKKNLKATCLSQGEEVNAYLIVKSKLYKNIILGLTNQNNIVMGSVKMFGKMKKLNKLTFTDISLFDFKNSSKSGVLYDVTMEFNNKKDEMKVIKHPLNKAEQVNIIARNIYAVNPAAMPGDLKGEQFLGLITGSSKMIKFTTGNIIVEDIKSKTTENFKYEDVTDYDYYFHKIGDAAEFLLEINNQLNTYKVKDGNLSLEELFNIFKQTPAKIKLPAYMNDDKKIVYESIISLKGLKSVTGNNMIRITDNNIYITEVKNKKPQPYKKIKISEIESYRKYDEMYSSNGMDRTRYGLEIKDVNGEKITFFSEAITPTDIEEIIEIIKK